MATTKAGIEIDVQYGSVREMRKAIKDARGELIQATLQFGEFSQEAINAAKKVAILKDRVGDMDALVQGMNPDKKFQAFSGAIRGVTGGFAGLQGAIGLFGTKSKEVEEQLLKVQSALALSEGLNSVMEARESFGRLAGIIKGEVVGGFKALKGAIGATGIGLLVIAIGTLIANFSEIRKKAEELFPALKNMGELWNTTKKYVMGFAAGAIEALKGVGILLVDLFRRDFSKLIADAKGLGGKVGKAFNDGFKGEEVNQFQQAVNAKLKTLVEANERTIKLMKAAQKDTTNIERETAYMKVALQKKGTKEYDDALTDAAVVELQTRKQGHAKVKKQEEAFQNDLTAMMTKHEKMRVNIRKGLINMFNEAQLDTEMRLVQMKEQDEKRKTELEAQYAAERLQIRQNEIASKAQMADAETALIEQGLGVLATAAGKNKTIARIIIAVQAALEIGRVLMSTAAAQAQVRAAAAAVPAILPPGIPNPAFFIAQANAAAQTALLQRQRVQSIAQIALATAGQLAGSYANAGGAGGGGGLPGNAGAPIAPIIPVGTTRLDSQTINDLGNRALNSRAYVLEADITDAQVRRRRIERAARLGG